ncbi:diaminopimelate decarboxylase [Weissella beninensis]|uniref:Diaminopimelate decarboxylase n=1 Tax=Periweissella beninensis TaxID=504936 RepID=A0ABT0VF50_9LACO|nr:diaminopimelate decarboxylase [Periweissella beninensis]MBM7543500.1 diaminopimelate decarboxylase [Periweissella beninensis]MCM2436482.1 diaminopimelate decarboxylase [Periweissella beninensis]
MNRVSVDSEDNLLIGGCKAIDLVEKYQTPLITYDVGMIRKTIRSLKQVFDEASLPYAISYASKAFATIAMYQVIKEERIHIDVVSGGELYTAMEANFPMEDVSFHGNNKSLEELKMALDLNVGEIVVDNFNELATLTQLAKERQQKVSIILRLTPGVSAHTHAYIQTGQSDSKFGFDIDSGQALDALKIALASEFLIVDGVHIHIGSQIFEEAGFELAIKKLLKTLANWRTLLNFTAKIINLGGGFGIKYTDKDDPKDPAELLKSLLDIVKVTLNQYDLPNASIWIEPGRSIVGPAGYTLYTVGTQKRVAGLKPYVTVDGGMGDNIRPALYQAEYTAVKANNVNAAVAEEVRLAGKYCESGDILIENQPMPLLRQGDVVAVLATGAYGYSMASNYNRNPRPAVVFVENQRAKLVVKRETYADLIKLDLPYKN